jgi:hypothetical protein
MRDLVVREALKAMAVDAAERLRQLTASGAQIPYDVEEPGAAAPLPQYVPLTERFIGDHAPVLTELDSFGSGCAAIESAGLARPYLEELGVACPFDERKRAELAGIAFLCRLWQGSTDFSLDEDRLRRAIAELESQGEAEADEIEVVVPLRGLQLPTTRLELGAVTIVRADTVEVPPEAKTPEGTGTAGWEPAFLAATRVGAPAQEGEPRPDAGARAVAAFRVLITTLRLFKAGDVSLGPYAWTRAGGDRWRRIATGAGRSRPGGYRLAEQELGDLAAVSRTLVDPSSPFARSVSARHEPSRALGRAISRFEAGLERTLPLEALNDHLLALRFLLEGGGPAELGLSMRVAALCAEPEGRDGTKAIVDRGVALERELWSGDPASAPAGSLGPAETTAEIEELARAILRDAACGHLGSDLRATADEILLADGLAAGEGSVGQRGGAEEWDPPGAEPDQPAEDGPEEQASDAPAAGRWIDAPSEWEAALPASERRAEMQVPEPEGRIKVESRPQPEEQNVFNPQIEPEPPTTAMEPLQPQGRLEELPEERPQERPQEQRQTADRVAYLFPRPDTTEWDVRELGYDRRRRARVRA